MAPVSQPWWQRIPPWPARVAWYIALALLLTWPVIRSPSQTLLGHAEASAPCHVWVLWWAQHHLSDIHTDLIFHPYGADVVTLYGSDVLSPVLLGWLPLSPVLLYNLWVMLLIAVGGLGMHTLARDRGASAGGALLAGTIFASAPFFQHEALNGTSEIVAIGLLPWFLLALFAVLERPDDRRPWWRPRRSTVAWGGALGVSCGLAVAASAYNLFFSLLSAAVVVVLLLATSDGPVFRKPVLQGIGAAVVGVAPFGAALAWLQATHGATAVYARRTRWTDPELAMPDSFAELNMWLSRAEARIPVLRELPGGETFEYWTTCTVFLGWVAVAAAAVGWWRGRRDRPVGTFAALGIVAFLVASGPYLRWDGALLVWGELRLPMPAMLIAEVFPPFVITAVHSYRYAGLVVLAVAALAGFAVRSRLVGRALAVAVLIDVVLLSPVPWPARTTPVATSPALVALADAPAGAVLQVPVEGENLGDLGLLLLAQVQHGKPVQDGGIHGRAGEAATALFREVPMVGDLARRGGPQLPVEKATVWNLLQLRAVGYRYVLAANRDEHVETRGWITGVLGPPAHADDLWMWWTIPPDLAPVPADREPP